MEGARIIIFVQPESDADLDASSGERSEISEDKTTEEKFILIDNANDDRRLVVNRSSKVSNDGGGDRLEALDERMKLAVSTDDANRNGGNVKSRRRKSELVGKKFWV